MNWKMWMRGNQKMSNLSSIEIHLTQIRFLRDSVEIPLLTLMLRTPQKSPLLRQNSHLALSTTRNSCISSN